VIIEVTSETFPSFSGGKVKFRNETTISKYDPGGHELLALPIIAVLISMIGDNLLND